MAPTSVKPKVPDEYLNKLKDKINAWDRKDPELNELVWKDLDLMIAKVKEKAYLEKCFEAYAYISRLELQVRDYERSLKAELMVISG